MLHKKKINALLSAKTDFIHKYEIYVCFRKKVGDKDVRQNRVTVHLLISVFNNAVRGYRNV